MKKVRKINLQKASSIMKQGRVIKSKHGFNFNYTQALFQCRWCDKIDKCPWVSVEDCIEATSNYWFGHLDLGITLD